MQSPSLRYSTRHIDRADQHRKDPEWLAARLAHPQTRFLPVWRDRNLVQGLDQSPPAPCGVTLTQDTAFSIIKAASTTVFLGLEGDTAVFAVDLSFMDEPQALGLIGLGILAIAAIVHFSRNE